MGLLYIFVEIFLNLLSVLVLIRVILSWFPQMNHSSLHSFLHDTTEPFYRLVRILPHKIAYVDLTPLMLLFLIDFSRMLFEYLFSFL